MAAELSKLARTTSALDDVIADVENWCLYRYSVNLAEFYTDKLDENDPARPPLSIAEQNAIRAGRLCFRLNMARAELAVLRRKYVVELQDAAELEDAVVHGIDR
jgi:hypothetical protein